MFRWMALVAILLLGSTAGAQVNRSTRLIPTVITTGGTFQTIIPAGAKFSFEIQNNNTNTDNCWIDFGMRSTGTTVTAGNAMEAESILLTPGGSFQRYSPNSPVPFDEIEATCATGGDTLRVTLQ